jgi:ELWxxDGT repeat protein
VLVRDVNPGAASAVPSSLTAFDDRLLFTANDGVHGRELWATDGTAAGTAMVKDIQAGAGGSSPFELTPADGVFYFSANDGVHGLELWRSDGTAAGTRLVEDVAPGAASSRSGVTADPRILDAGKSVLFSATDGDSGVELWQQGKNGAAALVEIAPGAASSNPEMLTGVGKVVFFLADDGTTGRELWLLSARENVPAGHLTHRASGFHGLSGKPGGEVDANAEALHVQLQNALDLEPAIPED